MKKIWLIVLLWVVVAESSSSQPKSRANGVSASKEWVSDYEGLLTKIVTKDGLIRYQVLQKETTVFHSVLRAIETYDALKLRTDEQKLAFWADAYNVLMLKNLLESPHIADIVRSGKADAFFKTPFLVGGMGLSLDEIEHGILRRQASSQVPAYLRVGKVDPRLHVVLNCGALSCPAFLPAPLSKGPMELQLKKAMAAFVNSPQHFRLDRQKNEWVVTSLVQWFGPDFDLSGKKAGDFLIGFMSSNRSDYVLLKKMLSGKEGKTLAALTQFEGKKVRFDYNWQPNRAKE
ncbi:MAG: DUF547 domain-containing protein [Bacteroidetes Order II. Incertae sedis bacterium]|nr:DUF547 domain-containing protein [Bacteroidetes Order II. bacterium]